MVKRILLSLALSTAFLCNLFASDPLASPSLEKLTPGKDIRDCISILEKCRGESGLEAVDHLWLYYYLKADGQREKAILAALEGLNSEPLSPIAPLLADKIEEDMTFNNLTEQIAGEVISSALEKEIEDPLLRFQLLRSLYILASRKGDKAAMGSILDRMGIPRGAFFGAPDSGLPRLKFLDASPALPQNEKLSWFGRDNFTLHMPSSFTDVKGEFCSEMQIPFRSSGSGRAFMIISTKSPVKAAVDGKTVFRNDPFKETCTAMNIVLLDLSEGEHIISLVYHSINANEGIALALFGMNGKSPSIEFEDRLPAPGALAASSFGGEYIHPVLKSLNDNSHLSLGLKALWYESAGDYPQARSCFEKAIKEDPAYVLWQIALAQLVIEKSYDLPESYAISKAEALIDGILESNPDCPEARFYKIYLRSSSSQGEDFLLDLKKMTEDSPSDPRWFIQLSRELAELGWSFEAQEILSKARSLFPQNSSLEEEWLSFCESARTPKEQLEALRDLSKLRNASNDYERYFASTGNYAEAVRCLDEQKALFGDFNLYFERARLDYLKKMGKYGEALEAAESLLRLNPDSNEFRLEKAGLLFRVGKVVEARGLLDDTLQKDPSVFEIDYAKWMLGEELPFEKERIPLEDALKDMNSRPEGAPSSYILDHQMTELFKDGSTLERYHGIVEVHDKDGVEKEGEQQFPSTYLLMLRTIKPDGTIVEPEKVPNKKTIGMSGLEAGDIIEYEYLTLSGPNGIKKKSYYTPYVFMFQDMEKPFAHTSWSIKFPRSYKMAFYEQNLPSPPQETAEGEYVTRKYEYKSMPRIAYEPDLPFKNLYLPLVDAVGNLDWKDYALALKNEVTGSYPVTLEIRDKLAEITKGARTDKEKTDIIFGYLLENIEGEGAGWGNPTDTLLLGEGNRLQLAMAFLTAAGIRFDFALAESVTEAEDKNPLPAEGRFQVPLLRIYDGGAPSDIILETPFRNIRVLPWYVQGAKAMIITSEEPWIPVTLNKDFGPWKACAQFEQRIVDVSGNLKVGISQTLDPDQSAQLRSALKKLPRDRWKEVMQMAFAKQFDNVEITNYDFRNLDDPVQDLVMTADATVSGFATLSGNMLRMEEPFERLELLKNLGSLEKRQLPLSTSSPFILNQTYKILLPEGTVSAVLPKKKDVASKYGEYSISTKKSGNCYTITRKAFIPFEIVPKDEYPAFTGFLKQIDDCEKAVIEVNLR